MSRAVLLFVFFLGLPALALENIVRPYQSVRTSGMGGVKYTTGLYDENLFANPARTTENPKSKFTLFDLMVETSPSTIGNVGDLIGSSQTLNAVGDSAGNNLHGRVQTTFPTYYRANPEGRYAWALGLVASAQTDLALRRSYQLDPGLVVDIGPVFSVARRFFDQKELSLGANVHFAYRASTRKDYRLVDFIQGKSFNPSDSGGDGADINVDAGVSWRFVHWTPGDWHFETGFAVSNAVGGGYNTIKLHFLDQQELPISQPTSVGGGLAARRDSVFFLKDFVVALEFSDLGNNGRGSIFRLFHFGMEGKYGLFKPRFGINQGYLAGGFGFNFGIFQADVATYGEEMSLNSGGLEDRRIALRLALEI